MIANPAFSVEGVDKLIDAEQLVFQDRTVGSRGQLQSARLHRFLRRSSRAALGANAAADFDAATADYITACLFEGRAIA